MAEVNVLNNTLSNSIAITAMVATIAVGSAAVNTYAYQCNNHQLIIYNNENDDKTSLSAVYSHNFNVVERITNSTESTQTKIIDNTSIDKCIVISPSRSMNIKKGKGNTIINYEGTVIKLAISEYNEVISEIKEGVVMKRKEKSMATKMSTPPVSIALNEYEVDDILLEDNYVLKQKRSRMKISKDERLVRRG